VRVEGPKTKATPKIWSKPDGTYDCEFTPTEPGEFTVHVTLDGVDVPGSPFKARAAHCPALPQDAPVGGRDVGMVGRCKCSTRPSGRRCAALTGPG
jgi:hypothetical protein